jgi:hypothetical protein
MIDLTNERAVKAIQSDMRTVFETPQGKGVMEFLEEACGWYESVFDPDNKDRILLNAGRREVVATIKTFLHHPPERIVAMALQKEQYNGKS